MKFLFLLFSIFTIACSSNIDKLSTKNSENDMEYKVNKPDSAWKAELTDFEYYVLRNKGTERPFSGDYDNHYEKGTYVCKGCGAELFTSTTKFDGHCGWPSFYDAIDKKNIKEIPDNSLGMSRIEVVCASCGGHLGHVFDDGPNPTGLRYCINSVSLGFVAKKDFNNEDDK